MFLQNDYNKNTAKTSFRKLFMNSKLFQNKVSKCRTYLLLIHKKKALLFLIYSVHVIIVIIMK